MRRCAPNTPAGKNLIAVSLEEAMKRQMRMWLIIGLLFVNAVLLGAETALAQSSMRFPSAIVLDWEPDPSGATQAVTIFAVVPAVNPLGRRMPSG